jgi:hypothetical protein
MNNKDAYIRFLEVQVEALEYELSQKELSLEEIHDLEDAGIPNYGTGDYSHWGEDAAYIAHMEGGY